MDFQKSSVLEGSVAEDNSLPAIIHETWEKQKKREQVITEIKQKKKKRKTVLRLTLSAWGKEHALWCDTDLTLNPGMKTHTL